MTTTPPAAGPSAPIAPTTPLFQQLPVAAIDWVGPVVAMVVVVALYVFTRHRLLGRLQKHAQRTSVRWDDLLVGLLASLRTWLLVPALVYGVVHVFVPPYWLDRALRLVCVVCLGVQALLTLRVLVDAGIDELMRRSRRGGEGGYSELSSSMTVIRIMVLGAAVVLIALAALDNMGVSVTPMLTGLGIGGVAIALAVQSILSDLFSSLSIILDKPFVVGDFIVVGDKQGTVEQIGIKTTRVRALSGEQLVFSNSDLLSSRIQNFKRMRERRVEFSFTVPLETPVPKLREIVQTVRGMFKTRQHAKLDRCHLTTPSDYGHTFQCVYIMQTPDYNEYMDVQQSIILELIETFRRMGVRFAARAGVVQGTVDPGDDGDDDNTDTASGSGTAASPETGQ